MFLAFSIFGLAVRTAANAKRNIGENVFVFWVGWNILEIVEMLEEIFMGFEKNEK